MKVLILNGSPAGENSITLQTVHFIQKYFPKQEYRELHAGQRIRMYEKDFTEAREALEWADLILFCYPVYTFLVPAQLHRFIELMKGGGVDLRGKWVTQITTSKHFYDVTAHEFIRENAEDAGCRVIRGLSADMEDLLSPKGRKEAIAFFRHVLWSVQRDGRGAAPEGKKIVVVADYDGENKVLPELIREFQEAAQCTVTVENIREFPFAGGCLGCFHCAADGKCIYKDHFDDFLREKIQTADACVYAFTIQDHSMGYRFKLFDDRQFCNGHRTVTMGKPVGYLIEGAYDREPNLKMLLEARAQVGGNYFAGAATGKEEARALAEELAYCMRHDYNQPADFYGVGGMKIFRDLIYQMQGMMREDHKFYKEHGFYDFPQKRKGTILGMYLVGAMMNNPELRRRMGGNLTKGMLMPYKSVIEKANKHRKKTGSESRAAKQEKRQRAENNKRKGAGYEKV